MSVLSRARSVGLIAGAIAALSCAGQSVAVAAAAGPGRPAGVLPAATPGLAGPAITLATNAQFNGYDIATDSSGKAYLGWIGDTGSGRTVYLCVLPRGARSCGDGGIQTADSLGSSSATDLRVLVSGSGKVSLVWFHDTAASLNGPQGSAIAETTLQNGFLSTPVDVASAPSFGSMLDAVIGPNGTIWTVTQPSGGSSKLQIRPGFASAPVTINAPYYVGTARLRFSGSTGVLAVQKYGSITTPVSYATKGGGGWSSFRKVAYTWTGGADLGLATTRSGIRLLASVNNASYYPVVSAWTGSGFSHPTPTGDRNHCSPFSHDPVADASGRMADVSIECGDLAIANLTDTRHAAVTRFSVHGTFAGGEPQITTAPSGRGWVAWSIESASGNKLLVAPVRLPGRAVRKSASSGGNRVTLTGPASCLPPVDLKVGVKGAPAAGWSIVGKVLKLGSKALGSTTLHGASLTPGTSHTLSGSVTFASGGSRRTVTATITFRSCPSP
jgi:hypothetical protein